MANLEDNVLGAIDRGGAKMRPRWFFVLRGVFAATGALILLVFVLYFASFVVFALHASGAWFAPGFGLSGWLILFYSLPWLLILLSLLFAFLLALLVRQYAFIYHRPLLYLLVAFLVFVGAASVFAATTALHPAFMGYAERYHLPFVQAFYEMEEGGASELHHGRILLVNGSGFLIENVAGRETSTVIVISTSSYGVGDFVVLVGERDAQGVIHPVRIQKVGF